MAVIECDPDESVDVVTVAWPLALSEPVPSVAPLSVNVTGPVGVPAADVTVAVKVTDCLKAEGFTEEVTVVAVVASATLTVCVKGAELLLL
jgi:hypothetical protein